MSAGITGRPRYYRHPSGATITVWPDGTFDARGANGKRKKTSATPEKLQAGHGQWEEVRHPDIPHEVLGMQQDAHEALGIRESVEIDTSGMHARVSNSEEHLP